MKELLCEACQKKVANEIEYRKVIDRKKRAYVSLTRLKKHLNEIQYVIEQDVLRG